MKEKIKKALYIPTFGEEVANSVSHGVMTVLMLVALPFSAVWAYLHNPSHPALASAGVSVFVISIFLMFLCSTLYHSMAPESKHKAVFHILDHIMIYFAIAGSYTPVALCVIGGWQGVLIVVIQWVMVLFGIFYTLGAIFYAKKGFRYHHLVWHLLINLAVICHFVGIVFFLN